MQRKSRPNFHCLHHRYHYHCLANGVCHKMTNSNRIEKIFWETSVANLGITKLWILRSPFWVKFVCSLLIIGILKNLASLSWQHWKRNENFLIMAIIMFFFPLFQTAWFSCQGTRFFHSSRQHILCVTDFFLAAYWWCWIQQKDLNETSIFKNTIETK